MDKSTGFPDKGYASNNAEGEKWKTGYARMNRKQESEGNVQSTTKIKLETAD